VVRLWCDGTLPVYVRISLADRVSPDAHAKRYARPSLFAQFLRQSLLKPIPVCLGRDLADDRGLWMRRNNGRDLLTRRTFGADDAPTGRFVPVCGHNSALTPPQPAERDGERRKQNYGPFKESFTLHRGHPTHMMP